MKMGITILAILAVFVSSSIAAAEVTLDISGFNSLNSMSVSLSGENMDYEGYFYGDPSDMMYASSGKSTEPDCFYELTMAFNENKAATSAATDSGNFGLTAKMITNAGDQNDPQQVFNLKAAHAVSDGNLVSSYENEEMKTQEKVVTKDASYAETISIDSNDLTALGKGSTALKELPAFVQETPVAVVPEFTNGYISLSSDFEYKEKGPGADSGDSEDSGQSESGSGADTGTTDKSSTMSNYDLLNLRGGISLEGPGFLHQVNTVGPQGLSSIGALVTGDNLVSNWKFGSYSGPDGSNTGMNVEGVSLEGANQLEMQAEGPNIPLQTFPPGQVTVDVTSEADADLSNYEEIVSSEGEAFYQDYPSAAATPTTSYYMNQLVTIDPAEEETSTDETSQNGGREYFNMVMGFVARK